MTLIWIKGRRRFPFLQQDSPFPQGALPGTRGQGEDCGSAVAARPRALIYVN